MTLPRGFSSKNLLALLVVGLLLLVGSLFTLKNNSSSSSLSRTRKLRGVEECVESMTSVLGRRNRLRNSRRNHNHNNNTQHRHLWFLGEVTEWYDSFFDTSPTYENATQNVSSTAVYTDVLIIGAGAAGLAAAMELTAADSSLEYLILESTNRIGGRVRSHTMGASGPNQVVVEDGANWIIPFDGNPLWQRAQELNLVGMANDYHNWVVYNDTGAPVDPAIVNAELQRFLKAYEAAGEDAEEQWTSKHEEFDDKGVVALLNDRGWTVASGASGNLDYILQWLYLDFEYAMSDVSVRDFPYEADNPILVTDQRGYQTVLNSIQSESVPSDRIQFNKRVMKIDYDVDVCLEECLGLCIGKNYKAMVTTADGTEYYAERVISTVSVGVLNNDLISFNPPLKYSHQQYNPFSMTQYIKIFYQFESKFWDDTEFVEITLNPENRGKCHHWQNMEKAIPGSGIIRCELMTEAFLELIDPLTQELSNVTLDSLLDPLRTVYGADVVGTPIEVYYPKINKDVDFGYGAYGSWKIGKTFTDFAKFFGGVDSLTDYCDHNGCNSDNEWILYLSGSASCYDQSEYVHGGFFSGQRSAQFALQSMGYDDVTVDTSMCDQYWNELE